MPPPARAARKNRLLAALPAAARRRLLARGEQVDLASAAVLCESGMAISHVYFPIDGYVTLVAGMDSGGTGIEVGLVGNEGMLGATLLLGVPVAPLRWLVQGAGRAWRIEAKTFLRELAVNSALRGALDRYLYVAMVQLAQTAACKRFHVVEARLARWLLMTRDRARTDRFHITHEILACIMGVRRAGITRAASSLQRRKLIHYSRGDLHVMDARGLAAASCGCYAADNATYVRVMSARGAPFRGSRRSYSFLTTA
jgi:CRP-like cAMP-binding protein